MSLSGKLEIFPLEEVLRLLARSHQSGCLRVEGPGAGRIYLEGGSMTYAAVEPDEALRAHLLAAGVVTEAALSSIDLSNGTLAEALAPGASTAALGDVIREQCVESVYRIRRPLAGPFAFTVDARPRWATGQSYDIEMIVSDHSPCTPELKRGSFLTAWGGIASVQFVLPVIWTEAQRRGFGLTDLARWLCGRTAQLARLSQKGAIEQGRDADFAIWSPEESFTVDDAVIRHRHKVTPYKGETLYGVVKETWVRGALAGEGRGRLL